MRRILITGLPRSGTTWLGRTLKRTAGTSYAYEPDNEVKEPFALKAKMGLGTFPVCDSDGGAGRLADVWEHAFQGRGRSDDFRDRFATYLLRRLPRDLARSSTAWRNARSTPRTKLVASLARPPSRRQDGDLVIVKSVYSAFCLDWIADRWGPEVVVVSRHPYNIVSSWLSLGWKGHDLYDRPELRSRYVEPFDLPRLDAGASRLERLTWEIGLLSVAFQDLLDRHPSWHVVRHEELCADPEPGFERLCERLGLTWTEEAANWLRASNAPGSGFEVRRLASEERDRWRRRLEPEEVSVIERMLAGFPLDLERVDRGA